LELGPLPIPATAAYFEFAACWQWPTAKLFWQHLLLKCIFFFRLQFFHTLSCSFPIFFAEAENGEEETAAILFQCNFSALKRVSFLDRPHHGHPAG